VFFFTSSPCLPQKPTLQILCIFTEIQKHFITSFLTALWNFVGKKEGVWGWPVNEDRAKNLSMFACWQGEGGGGRGGEDKFNILKKFFHFSSC